MSVRRLAKEQPASFTFADATMEKANWWIAKYPAERRQSAVIPILWLVQKQEGWVSEPAIRAIGEMLGMPFIRVLEVATFYTMFQLTPVGAALIGLTEGQSIDWTARDGRIHRLKVVTVEAPAG